MGLSEFLGCSRTSDSKKANVTSIQGGKWYIPPEKSKTFYKLIRKAYAKGETVPPLTETIGDVLPLIFDLDIKYSDEVTESQINVTCLKGVLEFLWCCVKDVIEIDDEKKYNDVYVLLKEKPYPCDKSGYKSKDGIHIVFPKIILSKPAYKILGEMIQEKQEALFQIFRETCQIPPSNLDDTLTDYKITRWMPYLCRKPGEDPYLVRYLFLMVGHDAEKRQDDLLDGDIPIYTDELFMNEMSMIRPTLQENVAYTELVENRLKPKPPPSSNTMAEEDDIYAAYYVDNNQVINPYKLVEENELKYVRGLVTCLSKKRATEYESWLSVGFCLHNINTELLPEWKEFSRLSDSYDPEGCDKQWSLNSTSSYDGPKYGIGSLVKWAKQDNEELFDEVKRNSVSDLVDKSVKNGSDADYLIAKVIHKYFENEFISVNVRDQWYYFNGTRWEKTVEGTKLRMAIHEKVYNIYTEYEKVYSKLKQEALDNAESDDERKDIQEGRSKEGRWLKNILNIKMKLLKDSYVTTLMNSLRNLFYKKDVAELFDANVNLLGFENGVVDLKEGILREGRPEDYLTMSTGYELSIGEERLPIKVKDLSSAMEENIANYDILKRHLLEFLKQIVPIDEVRDYTLRFLSKCLSGENRDEGFYIWTGSGGNGKSKLIELMQLVLGNYAGGLPVSLITSKRSSSNSATPEMERTKGLRFVVMQEPEANENINIGLMKELTGNDKIIARGLFKDPIEFIPQFKLLLMCNDLPSIPSNDDGTWRRLEVVDFISRFIDDVNQVNPSKNVFKRDKTLRAKLQAWPQVFLAILLEEWLKYDKEGITVPKQVNNKTKAYRNDNDIVGQWIDQCCEVGDNLVDEDGIERAPGDYENLYFLFTEWCKKQGYKVQDKKKTKDDLYKWQEKTVYGLSIGKNMKEGKPNGSLRTPKFNLIIPDE